MSKRLAGLALAVGLVGGGIVGGMFGIPSISGAQSTTTTPSTVTPPASADEGGSSSATSNEDATHEANESPEREAEEDSGQFHGGRHGSNEDPAHEATESPEREAQEDGGGGSNTPAPTTSPSTTPASQT
jgi:hypothetical protein